MGNEKCAEEVGGIWCTQSRRLWRPALVGVGWHIVSWCEACEFLKYCATKMMINSFHVVGSMLSKREEPIISLCACQFATTYGMHHSAMQQRTYGDGLELDVRLRLVRLWWQSF